MEHSHGPSTRSSRGKLSCNPRPEGPSQLEPRASACLPLPACALSGLYKGETRHLDRARETSPLYRSAGATVRFASARTKQCQATSSSLGGGRVTELRCPSVPSLRRRDAHITESPDAETVITQQPGQWPAQRHRGPMLCRAHVGEDLLLGRDAVNHPGRSRRRSP